MLELKTIQLNTRHSGPIAHSLLNDSTLQDLELLQLVNLTYGYLRTLKQWSQHQSHSNWIKYTPSTPELSKRWPIRSMLWINQNHEAFQLFIPSSDITSVIIPLPEINLFLASIYVPPTDQIQLKRTVDLIDLTYRDTMRTLRSGKMSRPWTWYTDISITWCSVDLIIELTTVSPPDDCR